MTTLDARLLAAHDRDDRAALVLLYTEAASSAPDDDARAFFLTHAYVFALEIGAPEAASLRQSLADLARI